MKIGFIGLGKLGLPCALAMEQKGHTVFGIDPSPLTQQIIQTKKLAYIEEHAQDALLNSKIELVDYPYLVEEADLIFVAVQTPHNPIFEGVTPITDDRADFDYTFLCTAIGALCQEIKQQNIEKDIIVISTVLPGTMRKYIRPIIQNYEIEDKFNLVYNPFFIAMGTTMNDFLNPEFILLGSPQQSTTDKITQFYSTIHNKPVFNTTVENAELIKVAYNTFIGMKIVFANTIMEICHKTPGTDCDSVVSAISLATDRLLSPKYLKGGMGDGGGCHPRDNIALSWLAQQLQLSHDFFEDIMLARENQTKWLKELIVDEMTKHQLPLVLMGLSFKPNTNIIVGSPARLLSHYLQESNILHLIFDPNVKNDKPPEFPAVYFISTQHEMWKDFKFPNKSVIIDPFRFLQNNTTISTYIPIGVHQ
jgi:UDPglucose 6-dehydrogenase